MLDMQNVKDIQITEGNVRTIHDKDSRLIWGRLAYDTKYAGDTLQNGTPTPDTPIPVQVVTGEQTVEISNGVDSEDFAVSLGSIELCKIGTYQDYIYKNGDDWYVHKETARVDVSSLSGWFASGSYAYKTRNGMSDILPTSSDSATAVGLCNAFSASTTNLVYAGSVDYGFALPGAGGVGILVRNKNVASLADFTTYLSNNPVYGYFALATATDTKITDATLVGQLNAVHEWLTRYGYSSTVTGNLPIIINQTNL